MGTPETHVADNGDELTHEEHLAIEHLRRVAARWPQTLRLVSMDGGLSVVRNCDPRYDFDYGHPAERQQAILANIEGIPNDGGGW